MLCFSIQIKITFIYTGRDYKHTLEMQKILKDELKSFDLILILVKGGQTRYFLLQKQVLKSLLPPNPIEFRTKHFSICYFHYGLLGHYFLTAKVEIAVTPPPIHPPPPSPYKTFLRLFFFSFLAIGPVFLTAKAFLKFAVTPILPTPSRIPYKTLLNLLFLGQYF
jgi:hypothetical protein